MGLQHRLAREAGEQCLEAAHVAGVEGEEQVREPRVLGALERRENGVQEQFAKVVYGIAQQGRDAQVVRTLHLLGLGHLGINVDACEKEEIVAVVVGILGLGRVVVAAHAIEGRVHDRLDGVERV